MAGFKYHLGASNLILCMLWQLFDSRIDFFRQYFIIISSFPLNPERNIMIFNGSEYHWKTGYDRQHMAGHFLDWENQPNLYKHYTGIQSIPLSPVSRFPNESIWGLAPPVANKPSARTLDKNRLSKILYLAGGITARRRQGGKDFYFRSVASAGALYPSEIYVGLYSGIDLDAGLYHFNVDNFALTPLRLGNFRGYSCEMTGPSRLDQRLCASFFLAGIFFRSAWKYRARAFRYVLLDTGHVLQNLILALASEKLNFSCHYDFNDEKMARLIGLDTRREVGLVCVNVYGGPLPATQEPVIEKIPAVDPLPAEIIMSSQVSQHEVAYEDMIRVYLAGTMNSTRPLSEKINTTGVTATGWEPVGKTDPSDEEHTYTPSVFFRRSKRNYIDQPLSGNKFRHLLNLLCRAGRADGACHAFTGLSVGFLSGNIDGFDPGFYLLDPDKEQTGKVADGHLINPMASICLDQRWLANAAVHFLFMANLEAIDRQTGARGYRYAMLNAGRIGQLIYLGATALGLGCCGIGALYDDEARELLGLNPGSALLYLVAAGPVKRA